MKKNNTSVVREVILDRKKTDYIAINSPSMARVMKGRRWYRKPERFHSTVVGLGTLHGLVGFMLRSMFWCVPGKRTQKDVLRFKEPGKVMLQTEGEYHLFDSVKKIEVTKAKRPLKVIKF